MASQAIINWSSQVPVGYEPSRTLTFMNLSPELPSGSMNFLAFPREIRDQIYKDMLHKPPNGAKYFKSHGWQLSHQFNFAVLRLNKQINEEASQIVYAELSLVLPVITSWSPEWATIDIGLPGTMHIKNVRIDFAVRADYSVANYLYYVRRGISALIQGVVRIIGQLPWLERVQVTHNGVLMDRQTQMSNALDLIYDMNFFSMADDFRYLKPLGRPGPYSNSIVFINKDLLRPTEPGASQWAIEFECIICRPWWTQSRLIDTFQDKFGEPVLKKAPVYESSEYTSSSDGSANGLEGPDFSMITEPDSSDESDLGYEGPDLSMIPEPCYTSSNMPPTDDGMDSEVEDDTGTTLDRLKIDQVEPDTENKDDDAKSDKKSVGTDSTKTAVWNPAHMPWPFSDPNPNGRLTHPSGGPWTPKFSDYCYLIG